MSTKTTNYSLHKIDLTDSPPDITVLNDNFDIIDEKLYEVAKKEYVPTPDFDNPLCWPGYTRVTTPEDEETATTVEAWMDSTTRTITVAKRTTVENSDGSYTETYEFYSTDGKTLTSKYIVVTTQDGTTETYYEAVTEVTE